MKIVKYYCESRSNSWGRSIAKLNWVWSCVRASVLQMNLDFPDLLDLAHDLPGWRYKWTCAICLINAKAGILLEFQLRDIANHLFVYFDTDQTPWVRCRKCKHKFHLTCITCMTSAELLATGDFVCCSNWTVNWTRFIVICFHSTQTGTCCVQLKPNQFTVVESWQGRSSRRKKDQQCPALQENGTRSSPMKVTNWINGVQPICKMLWQSK